MIIFSQESSAITDGFLKLPETFNLPVASPDTKLLGKKLLISSILAFSKSNKTSTELFLKSPFPLIVK